MILQLLANSEFVKEVPTNPLSFLHLKNIPILEQLHLEEALLRSDSQNWCLINEGSPDAIVMGVSGKKEEFINENRAVGIPIIKRFSGGGTVFVDNNTIFVSFIFNQEQLPIDPFPQSVMKWSGEFYNQVFGSSFALRENDYTFGLQKFGGNAQYFTKNRWLHHTTFLWDYDPEKMLSLQMPKKKPLYRKERAHRDFLCSLKKFFPSKEFVINRLIKELSATFLLKHSTLAHAKQALKLPHRQATKLLEEKSHPKTVSPTFSASALS